MKHFLLSCIFLFESMLALAQWVPVGSSGFSAGSTNRISLAFNNGVPYVAYEDNVNGARATVMQFNGNAWVPVGAPGFSEEQATYISLAFNNGVPYVAYSSNVLGDKATVRQYNGSTWVPVGNSGFTAGVAFDISLAINNGLPYVAYEDHENDDKATVMQYNGSAWMPVGSPGFSAGSVNQIYIAINNGVPYVVYDDDNNGSKATVMQYNGSAWVPVGNSGFSAGEADYPTLAFNNGVPYVAYTDVANGSKATVMQYNGSAWVSVGSSGFSAGQAEYTTLALNNGALYVAYADVANGNKATVMQYNGSAWVPVGSPGFSPGSVKFTSLAINNGVPYVAYTDDANGSKATVMVYDAISTASLSASSYCSGASLPVSYTARGTYNSSNTFTAQLSDAAGNFASPVNIGTLNSITSGTINAVIPSNTAAGISYRIRVFSNSPAVTGSDNGANITINALQISYRDADFDGYGDPNNSVRGCGVPLFYVSNNLDCDDTNPTVYPGAPEICDGLDNNCNGQVDEGVQSTFYHDADGDGFGNSIDTIHACSPRQGYITDNTDCNDNDASVHTAHQYYVDADGDGYGSTTTALLCFSTPPVGYSVNNNDCNDKDATINPNTVWVLDKDGDGYYSGSPLTQCTSPGAGYVVKTTQQPGDPVDNDNTIYPGAPELCDGKDNNGNGQVDEGCSNITAYLLPSFTIEGNSGKVPMIFTIILNKPATVSCSVKYTTYDLTAKAGSDYQQTSGTLSFTKGQWLKFITVYVYGDKVVEPNEQFGVQLQNPVNVKINGSGKTTGTIINDDHVQNNSGLAMEPIAGREISSSSRSIKIFPNPASNLVNIKLEGYTGNITIQLLTVEGKIVRHQKLQALAKFAQQQINVGGLSAGIYLLTVVDDKGSRQIEKVIIGR